MSIALILLGMFHKWVGRFRYVYPVTIGAIGFVSVLYVLEQAGLSLGFISTICHQLPLYTFFRLGLGYCRYYCSSFEYDV